MPQWKIIQPDTPEQWKAYYGLRFKVLRQPWGQPEGSEVASDDPESIHGMIYTNDGHVLAAGRIHQNALHQAQIRFMAVDPAWQGKGLGQAILTYLEMMAVKKYPHLKSICLQARENAVNFYVKNGYQIKEKTFLLFGEIQHYLMEKPVHSV